MWGLVGLNRVVEHIADQVSVRLSSKGGSFAATHRLVAGDVLKAPRHKRSAWF